MLNIIENMKASRIQLRRINICISITLMEESLCGRKFCGSAEPQNFCILRE